MLDSMLRAFSLYSRIPVPQAKWNDRSMRWCLCFLPLVGAVIGAAQLAAFTALTAFPFGRVFRGAVLTVLPILLSGGIHMDGFMDTCDAIHSYGSMEKRLEILKDPHVGAFAVIGGIVYFVLDFGIWTEAGREEIPLLCLLFVLSRALSAFAAVTFPKAKKDGMLRQERVNIIANGIADTIPKHYPDLFPLARAMKRHFIIHIGPTNSGKMVERLDQVLMTSLYLSSFVARPRR